MKPRHERRLSAVACAIAAVAMLWAGMSYAQVRPIGGGNVLDANPQVGSGGYNGARPVTSGINGNLIMSGNVTGGKAFQGYSPIYGTSALQTTTGIGSLSNFVRDSVGLPGIQGGLSPYTARPYFDLPRTTVSAGTVAAQSVLPRDVNSTYQLGHNQYQMPVATLAGTRSSSVYAGQLPYAAAGWTPAGIGMFNPDLVATSAGEGNSNPLQQYAAPGPTGVSQVGTSSWRTGTQVTLPGMPPVEPIVQARQPGLEPAEAAGLQRLGQDVWLAPPSGPEGDTGSGLPNAGQTDSTLLTQMQQRYSETALQTSPPDSSAQLQQSATAQKQVQPGDVSVATAARRPTDETRLIRPGVGQDRERLLAERDQASRLVEERLSTPIRSLAGARQTQVDKLLAQAEEQMRKGDYYKASGTYGGVITAAPDNALAWLGRANALLAAGEYVQAYVALAQGIERFPQLLSFDFDLPALLGNKDIVDVRRAELEKILTANPDYRMRFLLGYLECYSGLREIGLQTMRQAAKEAPAGSIVPKALEVLSGRGQGPEVRGQ